MSEGLVIKRRKLPHWSLEGSTYFLTWCLLRRVGHLTGAERDIIVENLLHLNNDRYRLFAYVVMNDHVHVVVRPVPSQQLNMLVKSWKSYTAKKINRLRGRTGKLWQTEWYDRIIRDESEFVEKLEYVITNPVRRWPEIHDYKWAGWFADG